MRPTMGRELAIAVFLVAFGTAVVVLAGRIGSGVPTDPLGPRTFPSALGAGIALCGSLLGAAALVFRGQPARAGLLSDVDPEEDIEAGPFSTSRFVGAIVTTAAYLAAFERLGYLLATPLYVAAIMLIHGGAGKRALLVGSVLSTLALYLTFRFGLLIPVPDGILEEILR